MVEHVRLLDSHLELLINVFQQCVDYKYRKLAKHNWEEFESNYLPKLVDSMSQNKFRIADAHNNILTWTIDNIQHSRVVISGTRQNTWPPLTDLPEVQQCIEMLTAAARGPVSYDCYCKNQAFKNMFS